MAVMAHASAGEELLVNASWIERNWMWLSLGAGVLNIIIWLTRRPIKASEFPIFLGFILSSIYSLHQLEEHGYDIYGRRYMFVPTFNAIMGKALGVTVSNAATVYINVVTVWVCFPICAYMSHPGNWYIPAAISWGTAVVNGVVGHLVPLVMKQYVPGAFQSAFMVPVGIMILLRYYDRVPFLIPIICGFNFHAVGLIMPVKLFPNLPQCIILPFFMLFAGVVIPLTIAHLFVSWGKDVDAYFSNPSKHTD